MRSGALVVKYPSGVTDGSDLKVEILDWCSHKGRAHKGPWNTNTASEVQVARRAQ